ncbi:hypothetical protein GJ699_02635 [Duganella sp. FT80W]|uniref:Uncharacterized protein n=1 Tax=Duganella guangzhouensis TaxID=2666084 RepID=A0A6I2KSP6_9BURK|nr:hypothetical protein [Duganella guangzhouensis]MRW88875.1 hypothetical protein [Duganella guangzhouensis]
MVPQGSALLNLDHFTNLTKSINAVASCDELRVLAADALASIAAVEAGIQAELAAIAPILALLQPPGANLGAIVTWLTNYISHVLTPLVKPNITFAAQLTQIAAQIAELTAAIQSASVRFPNCSI